MADGWPDAPGRSRRPIHRDWSLELKAAEEHGARRERARIRRFISATDGDTVWLEFGMSAGEVKYLLGRLKQATRAPKRKARRGK